jgi:hypothetical protein
MATVKINSLLCYVQRIKYGVYDIMINVSIIESYIRTHLNFGYILKERFLSLVDM